MSQQFINLITEGILVSDLHYGVFVRNWWVQKTIKNSKNQILPISYRLYMRVTCKLNNELFTLSIVQSITNPLQLGFVCTCKEKSTEIMTSTSAAKILYIKKYLNEKLKPFSVVITSIGYSDNNELNGAGSGFSSSIITRFQGKQSIILQQIKNNVCVLDIYQESKKIIQYQDETPNNVWKKSGINKKYNGNDLFGITHPIVQSILHQSPINRHICMPNEWNNSDYLQQAFDRHIKSRKITTSILLDWKSLFDDWLLQKSTIIQIPKSLQKIYPNNYQICEKELRAWKVMLKSCGCSDVTPFEKDVSDIEFWSRAIDPSVIDNSDLFWENFQVALKNNKRGIAGKIRILSIIANKFCYKDLREKLQVGSTSINSACKHARLNGPGAPPISKPQRTVHYMSEIKEKEFELFFQDKSNVSMSSYKVDAKTNLPILYLQDQKQALWYKFEELYPNGMKKTSFMARLTNCNHIKYQEDLGGLCSICNDYGFEAFQNLMAIVRNTFMTK
ncbi:9454_t:CDS:2 [Diversispora eburnea]|uniref:9454_t:CDS:1 n=1 Tax=Diversispora eburnea TaxID=1213867 RepID=A0A9N9CA09_9GLOM|nr:9454_t:CDS:2 [Diversispora eburnea]